MLELLQDGFLFAFSCCQKASMDGDSDDRDSAVATEYGVIQDYLDGKQNSGGQRNGIS